MLFRSVESEKVGLKLNIQKMKIMASGPITSRQIDGGTVETSRRRSPRRREGPPQKEKALAQAQRPAAERPQEGRRGEEAEAQPDWAPRQEAGQEPLRAQRGREVLLLDRFLLQKQEGAEGH